MIKLPFEKFINHLLSTSELIKSNKVCDEYGIEQCKINTQWEIKRQIGTYEKAFMYIMKLKVINKCGNNYK